MEIKNGTLSKETLSNLKHSLKVRKFISRFEFLNSHAGLRSAEVSTIIAPYGGGKSTLVRTIQLELMQQHVTTYTFLSEERVDYYACPLNSAVLKMTKDNEEAAHTYLKNALFQSQLDLKREKKRLDVFIKDLEDAIITYGVEVVIFDNFTTSFMGRAPIDRQAEAVEQFKELAARYNISFILVVHTMKGTNIYKDIVTGESVRGNATTTNIGSYNYVLTTYFRLKVPRSFVTIDKARYHSGANKKVFELEFDSETGLFCNDRASSFDIMQAIVRDINKCSRRVEVSL
jgi:hypothetical protein